MKVDHFANDTSLLCLRNFIKKLKKLFNAHLKHLVHWQKANKISLNVKITEMVIFKSMWKKFEGDLKIRLCGKTLYPTESANYLGVGQVNNLSIKLKRPNAFLFKIRQYINPKILRSVYFLIFELQLSCCPLMWSQKFKIIQQIVILQKRVVRLINFQPRIFPTSSLLKHN